MTFCRLPHLQGVCFLIPCTPQQPAPPRRRKSGGRPPAGGAARRTARAGRRVLSPQADPSAGSLRSPPVPPRKLIPLRARCARPRYLPASRSLCGLAALAPGTSPQADPSAGSLRSPPVPPRKLIPLRARFARPLPISIVQNSQKQQRNSVTSSTHPQNVTVL